MKTQTKQKKREQLKNQICEKAQDESIRMLDSYFKKGNKARGYAMAILAVAFWSGFNAGEEYSYKCKEVN